MKRNTFIDKQKLREFVASRPNLQEIRKEVLQAESQLPWLVIQILTKNTTKDN